MTQFWPSSCRYKQAEHMNHADPWPSNTDHLDHMTTVKSSLLVTQTELYPDRISPSHQLQKYSSSENYRNPFSVRKAGQLAMIAIGTRL